MDKIIIEGGRRLEGTVKISGAKNAVLPIMAACILADTPSKIRGVPRLRDVNTMMEILRALGAEVEWNGEDEITVDPRKINNFVAPYELVSTMRASICVLGPLIAKFGKARVSHPGGCVIGPRPVDLHIKGLRELGADIRVEHGYIVAEGRLRGKEIYLGGPAGSTVLGTENVMMAAVLAEGTTIIENAACEPEVADLARFLNKMGAKITGAGSPRIKITGVATLKGTEHKVIPDRIEAGTFMVAAGITGGDLTLKGARWEHLGAVIDTLHQAGMYIERVKGGLRVCGSYNLRAVNVTTLPYPGFPTDMQAQLMALMTQADGISVITERIYPDRFMHVSELLRMGANIIREGPRAIVMGRARLSGAPVMASDLRASAALILAGLVAEGKTEVSRVYHIDRGYERIEEKLSAVGARIWRVRE